MKRAGAFPLFNALLLYPSSLYPWCNEQDLTADMKEVLEFIATLTAGLFTGAALYINWVEHPARMSCGTALAVREFAPSYNRATVMQVLLAVTAFLSALNARLMGASILWLLGGIIILAVIPFTVVVILPVNKRLLDPALDQGSQEAKELLQRWGRLHAVRSGLALVAMLLFLYALVWK